MFVTKAHGYFIVARFGGQIGYGHGAVFLIGVGDLQQADWNDVRKTEKERDIKTCVKKNDEKGVDINILFCVFCVCFFFHRSYGLNASALNYTLSEMKRPQINSPYSKYKV